MIITIIILCLYYYKTLMTTTLLQKSDETRNEYLLNSNNKSPVMLDGWSSETIVKVSIYIQVPARRWLSGRYSMRA